MSRRKIGAIAVVIGAFASLVAAPAFATSSIYSVDANRGALVGFLSANARLSVQDTSYDGWGALGSWTVGALSKNCINEQGFNTSSWCTPNSGIIPSIVYRSCLEHNAGATIQYCSAGRGDYA